VSEDVLFVPLKPSHTNGDVAAYFTQSDVWAFGDVYTTDYPSIGVAQGGTIENFIDNYNKALEMTTPTRSSCRGMRSSRSAPT
jgi:hypothetical protein